MTDLMQDENELLSIFEKYLQINYTNIIYT